VVSPNIFYTYAYLREDGTPYYIGKGKGRRAFRKERLISTPPIERILFLKKNLTETDAFKHEIYMIAVFGRKDLGTGILRNMTDGGEGMSGHIPSAETIVKLRISHQGKKHTQETRDKMSQVRRGKPQPDKRKPRTANVKQKISQTMTGRKLSVSHCQKISEANKGVHVGKTWWVNERNEVKFCHEPPGFEWAKGRKWKG
jgi:hypothetical protein